MSTRNIINWFETNILIGCLMDSSGPRVFRCCIIQAFVYDHIRNPFMHLPSSEDIFLYQVLPLVPHDDLLLLFIENMIAREDYLRTMAKSPEQVMEYYSELGQLKPLKQLCEKGFPLLTSLCSIAARRGSREQITLLRELNCPWDETTFTAAARVGHFKLMKWLLQVRCPWSAETMKASSHSPKQMRWLRSNGCPSSDYFLPPTPRPECDYPSVPAHLRGYFLSW